MGALLSLERLRTLAQSWYHDRMQIDFRGRTVAEAQAIFHALGLDDAFWAHDK